MRVKQVLEAYNDWLVEAGLIHAKDRVGLTDRFLSSRTAGIGERHIHDGDVERWDQQIAREAEAEEAAYKAGERICTRQCTPGNPSPGCPVHSAELQVAEGTVMDQAAQELLRIVKGEVKAKRYADDEEGTDPTFDERIRAAECLLGNRTELDVKGLDAIMHRVAGSTGPR